MLTLNQRLQPNREEVAAKVMDGEAILINLSNGIYYSMDKVGAVIWEMIENSYALEEMVTAITGRYQVAVDQARGDLERLLTQLIEERLVLETGDEATSDNKQPDMLDKKLPYDPPNLNIYRDMGDLLALDPPMPGLDATPWKEPDQDNND